MRPFLLLTVLLPLLGCAHDEEMRRRELAEISAQHTSAVVEFEHARSEFAHRYRAPEQLDFGQDGTILVDECALEGLTGHERVWVKYTYVNTTGASIDAARITLTLHDPDSGGAGVGGGGAGDRSQQTELKLPFTFRFSPDSSYSTHFEMPTEGIHLHPNWSWQIRAEAIRHPSQK
jgi:hypothetical protein